MDLLSSSSFNLNLEENEKALLEQRRQSSGRFSEAIASCVSLSDYEGKKLNTLLPQIFASLLAGSFHVVFGISVAYSAILIPQLVEAQNSTNATNGNSSDVIWVTENDNSWIASVIVIVAPVGALAGGFIMDSIGRLNLIKLAAIPSTIGWVLIATATNVPMLIVGRILTGIASAWGTSPAIVYITEIARADMRGSLISIAPAYASLGMVLAYLKGWFMTWRAVAWLCTIYSIVPVFMILFVPESPPWLVSKGRDKQAKKSLDWLNKFQPQPAYMSETFSEMSLAALQKEHRTKMEEQSRMDGNNLKKKLKMFLQPTAYKPLFILSGLFFFQQFSGTYITLFYAVTFFKDVGTDINPYLASIFLGAVRFGMSMVNTWLMKRFKRRALLTWSALGMAACMAISGLFTRWIHEGTTTKSWIPVLMLVVYVITSMVGLLSIPWTIIAELFPIAIRGVAHSIVYGIANLIMFAAIQSYFKLDRLFGGSSGLQFFFAVISLGGLVYSYVLLPETHNMKLADIENYFLHHTTFLSMRSDERSCRTPILRKPIVKHSRITQQDFMRKIDEQNEKMIQNHV